MPLMKENLLNDVIAGENDQHTQTSLLISDLNSKINSPGQGTNKILKTNNYNNQRFNLQLSTAQASRQK